MLRYTFEKSDGVVRVTREAEWLNDYLALQALRFGASFEYMIHVAPGAEDWPMRKLLLQPFFENCVLHGFAGMTCDGLLTVRFRPHYAARLRIAIRDNGHGIPPDTVARLNRFFKGANEEAAGSVGLENVSLRIRSYYGDSARIFIRNAVGQGMVIALLLLRLESA